MQYLTPPALLIPTPTECLKGIQLWPEPHKISHDSPTKFVLHQSNDMLVYSYGKRMILTVATHVEPSINIISNVLVEIISLEVINKGVSVHITQLEALAVLGDHVVMMEFVHDNLTKIEDDLP